MQVELHPELGSQMNRCEIMIYYLLSGMIRRQARKSPRGAMYAHPSQGWMAKELGYSREWVCRCMKRLDGLGVFQKINRSKKKGWFRSCMYKFGWLFWKLAGKTKEAVRALLFRVTCSHHISKPKDIKEKQNPIINQNNPGTDQKIEENLIRVRSIIKTLA